MRFLSAMRISQTRLKLLYSLLTIVLSATSSASSEDTPSTHEIGRISAEVFSDDDESSLLERGSCGVTMSSCLFALVCLEVVSSSK